MADATTAGSTRSYPSRRCSLLLSLCFVWHTLSCCRSKSARAQLLQQARRLFSKPSPRHLLRTILSRFDYLLSLSEIIAHFATRPRFVGNVSHSLLSQVDCFSVRVRDHVGSRRPSSIPHLPCLPRPHYTRGDQGDIQEDAESVQSQLASELLLCRLRAEHAQVSQTLSRLCFY